MTGPFSASFPQFPLREDTDPCCNLCFAAAHVGAIAINTALANNAIPQPGLYIIRFTTMISAGSPGAIIAIQWSKVHDAAGTGLDPLAIQSITDIGGPIDRCEITARFAKGGVLQSRTLETGIAAGITVRTLVNLKLISR